MTALECYLIEIPKLCESAASKIGPKGLKEPLTPEENCALGVAADFEVIESKDEDGDFEVTLKNEIYVSVVNGKFNVREGGPAKELVNEY